MISFITTALVAALLASSGVVHAFAPSGMGAAARPATTSLHMSHFSTVSTKLYHKEQLLKALHDMNIPSIQTASAAEETIEARGYQGETLAGGADIVIPQANHHDLAFVRNNDGDQTYELVTDLQFWQQSVPVEVFLEKVHQNYAIHTLVDASAKDGFSVDQVTTQSATDGTVTLKLSRYNHVGA